MALKDQFSTAVVCETDLTKTAVTFGTSETTSSTLQVGNVAAAGIFTPDGWTTADISFTTCKTPDGTFVPITNFDGTAFSLSGIAASLFVPLNPAIFNSMLYLKVVSSVAQTDQTVDFALIPIFQGLHA